MFPVNPAKMSCLLPQWMQAERLKPASQTCLLKRAQWSFHALPARHDAICQQSTTLSNAQRNNVCALSFRVQASSYHLYMATGNFLCGSADEVSGQKRASNWISALLLKAQLSMAKLGGRRVWILVSWCKWGTLVTYASVFEWSMWTKPGGAFSRTCVNKWRNASTLKRCVPHFCQYTAYFSSSDVQRNTLCCCATCTLLHTITVFIQLTTKVRISVHYFKIPVCFYHGSNVTKRFIHVHIFIKRASRSNQCIHPSRVTGSWSPSQQSKWKNQSICIGKRHIRFHSLQFHYNSLLEFGLLVEFLEYG